MTLAKGGRAPGTSKLAVQHPPLSSSGSAKACRLLTSHVSTRSFSAPEVADALEDVFEIVSVDAALSDDAMESEAIGFC